MIRRLLPLSDEALIDQLRSDGETAFAELYRRYARKLVQIAFRKLGDQTVAEDIVHELFLKLWLNRSDLRIRKTVSTYLQSALKKRIITHYYQQASRRAISIDDLTDSDLTKTVMNQDVLPDGFVRDFYERSLLALPEKCREVFVMSRNGFTSREIAQQLQISEKTVEGHITKALRILRAQMKDYALIVLILMTVS